MRCFPVSARINHVANDDEEGSRLVEVVETQDRLFLLETRGMPSERNYQLGVTLVHWLKRQPSKADYGLVDQHRCVLNFETTSANPINRAWCSANLSPNALYT
jgi:hypothetical protein